MPWYDPTSWSADDVKRAGLAAATMGQSEILRAGLGEESVYDPILDAAGLGIDRNDAPPPDPNAFFDTAEGSAAENYARAQALWERSQQVRAPHIRDTAPIIAPTIDAPDIRNAGRGEGAHRADVTGVTAGQVSAGPDVGLRSIAPVERITSFGRLESQDVGPIGLQRASADPAAGALLRSAAEGRAPSAAEAGMRYALDQGAKRRASMAAGARGADRAGARLSAMLQTGDDTAASMNQFAQARAGEMATARGQFSQFAMQSASLEAEQNRVQAELDRAIAQGNQEQANALQQRTAELEARRQEINAAAENARAEQQQGRQLDVDVGNRATRIGVDTGNVGRTFAADTFTAGAQNVASMDFARRQDESDQAYLARLQNMYNQQASMQLDAAGQNAQRNLQMQIENVRARLERDIAAGQQGLTAEQLTLGGMSDAGRLAQGATDTQTEIAGAKYGADLDRWNAAEQRENQQKMGRQQMAGQIGGALIGGPLGAKVGGQAASHVGARDSQGVEKFAGGGVVSGPQLAMIGEAGPEAVIPLAPRASAADALAATLRRSPGGDKKLARDLSTAMAAAAARAKKERRAA